MKYAVWGTGINAAKFIYGLHDNINIDFVISNDLSVVSFCDYKVYRLDYIIPLSKINLICLLGYIIKWNLFSLYLNMSKRFTDGEKIFKTLNTYRMGHNFVGYI